MQKLSFKTSSEFNEAFQAFQSSNLAQELKEYFRVKPFFEQYAKLRQTVAATSWFIHFFAVATSFIGVFTFILPLVKQPLVSGTLAAIFLLLIEVLKRLVIPTAIKNYLQFRKFSIFLILSSLALTTLSVTLSFTGAHDTVTLLTPDAKTIDSEPTRKEYKDRIKQLRQDQRQIKKSMSWKGNLTPQGAKAYNEVTAQIGRIESDMINNLNRITADNATSLQNHKQSTNVRSDLFAIFALIFDLSLFFAFWFLEYYNYRSFTEFSEHQAANNDDHQEDTNRSQALNNNTIVATDVKEMEQKNTVATVATDNLGFSLNTNAVELAIKKAKGNIAAYNAKINKGEGRPESNKQGLEKWKHELEQLEQLQNLSYS